jgi:hypothetical protein
MTLNQSPTIIHYNLVKVRLRVHTETSIYLKLENFGIWGTKQIM